MENQPLTTLMTKFKIKCYLVDIKEQEVFLQMLFYLISTPNRKTQNGMKDKILDVFESI